MNYRRVASAVFLLCGSGLFTYGLFGFQNSVYGYSYAESARIGVAAGAVLIVAGLIGWLWHKS